MFNDKDINNMHSRINKVFWKILLVYFCCIVSFVGGFIWLLLYILNTYVGKA